MASGQRAGEGSDGGMVPGGLRPAHVEGATNGGGGRAWGEYFECRTFTSFQALGGHRTGHTRLAARQRQEHGAGAVAVAGANYRRVAAQWHPCGVCGVEFRMGQALGGHMRRHRGEASPPAESAAVSSVEPQEVLDLNSPPVEEASEGDQEVERVEQEPRLFNLLV